MTNYIPADQLKAEIERRLSNIVTGLDFTAEIELKGLLSFLDSIPPIQSLNRDHVARIIELWQDVEHDVEWCNEPSEFMYDEVLRRFNLDTIPEQPVEGLEEEYQEFCKDYPFPWSSQYVNREYIDELCLSVARHFYELGCRRTAVMYDDIEYNRQREEEAELSGDLEEEVKRYWNAHALDYRIGRVADIDFLQLAARHFAEWGASHAVAPHYFKLRELKTGRVFFAEWSDIAGEWYERGNGKAHQSDEVEIVQHLKK